jgi:hypothetical protein
MSEDTPEVLGGEPKVVAQLVIQLLDNQTTNFSYTCDELMARALLDKGRSILDFKCAEDIRAAQARIITPTNGAGRRPGVQDIRL